MKNLKVISTLLVAASAYMMPVANLSASVVENTLTAQDGSGNAIGIWDVIDGVTEIRSIQVSTQAVGSGTWSTPITISMSGIDSFTPMLAVNSNGDAVAVWSLIDPVFAITSLAGAYYTNSTGTWSSPTILSTSNELTGIPYNVVLNDNGNFCAVWNSNLMSSGLTVARGVLGSISGGWGTASDMSAEQ